MKFGLPEREGLYDPAFEHDSCGVGFLANIDGTKTHELINQAIQVLINLTHRGAVGSDPDTGDGAGFLFQLPDEFFRGGAAGLDFSLPEYGKYGVGMAFLPPNGFARRECMAIVEEEAHKKGCRLLGWRDVPYDSSSVGVTARANCPDVKQFFLAGPDEDAAALERRLYLVRRLIEKHVAASEADGMEHFHIPQPVRPHHFL